MTKAQILAVGSSAGLEACEHEPLPAPKTQLEIAAQLRWLAEHMADIATSMDYYGGMAPWAQHARELAGAALIASEWAGEIEAANAKFRPGL